MNKRDLMYSGMTTRDENTCDHLMYDSTNMSEHYCEKYGYRRISQTDKMNCENFNRDGSCFLGKKAEIEAKEKAEREAKEAAERAAKEAKEKAEREAEREAHNQWLTTEEGKRWQAEEEEKKRKAQAEEEEKKRKAQAEEEEKKRKAQAEEEEKKRKAQEKELQIKKERPLRIIAMILCFVSSVFLFYLIYIKGLFSVMIGSVINGSVLCFLSGISGINISLSKRINAGIIFAVIGALLGLLLGWLAGLMGGIRIIWAIVTFIACFLPLAGGNTKT